MTNKFRPKINIRIAFKNMLFKYECSNTKPVRKIIRLPIKIKAKLVCLNMFIIGMFSKSYYKLSIRGLV